MGLGILSRKYRTQTRGVTDLSILQACIGEEIKVITEFYFDKFYICDDVNNRVVRFVPTADNSGSLYNNDLIFFSESDFLNSSKVGDIFTSSDNNGAVGPFTLLEILNGGTVGRFDRTFIQNGLNTPDEYVANITALKSLIYQYNISEGGDFASKTDGSLQKFIIDSDTALTDEVSLDMLPLGDKDWQIDSIVLVGLGDDTPNFPANTRVRIKTTHTVVVTPLFLVGQLSDLTNGIAPDYFKPDNNIKYKSQIDWNKNNTFLDPNKRLVLDDTGKFGWFNNRFDGAKSDYSITSFTIKRVSDEEFVNQLEYNEMEVKVIVNSTAGNFSNVNSRLVFGFNYLPQDETLYKNTDRFLEDNFSFESKLLTPDNVTVDGNNFGTNDQVIKTIKGQVTSANTCEITVRILFGSNRVSILTQEDIANYSMWVICENINLDVQLCDKSNLLIQVDEIHVQLTTVDLLDETTKFLEHPYEDLSNGADTLEMFPVDDVVANSQFSIDFTGLENDGILLKACIPSLVLAHDTEADIKLDSVRINLDNFQTVGSAPAVQLIDFSQIRPYKIEDGIRKKITLSRDFAEETDSIKKFVLNFPFMNRWEYWLQIAGITSIPEDIFDNSVPFNGANHLWNRLANIDGWTLKYKIRFEILQNGELFEQEFEHDLSSTDFESNPEWDNCSIKTYDLDTDDEITIGPKKYAYAGKDVLVKARFEKTSGDVPDLENVAIVIWAEGYEGGGITEITRISSQYEVTGVSAFKSVDATNKVKITKVDDTFIGEAILNFEKIKNLSRLTLYARIYHPYEDLEEFARITNDEILRYTTDEQVRLINYGDDPEPASFFEEFGIADCGLSLERLDENFIGDIIWVLRESDEEIEEFGFNEDGTLDTVGILAFIGAGNGYLRRWYFQGLDEGQYIDMDDIGVMPRIVNAGVLETENDKPCINFGTSANMWYMRFPGGYLDGTTEISLFGVWKITDEPGSNAGVIGPFETNSTGLEILQADAISRRTMLRTNGNLRNDNADEEYQIWNDDDTTVTSILGNPTSLKAYKNSIEVTMTDGSAMVPLSYAGVYTLGQYSSGNYMNGKVQEILIYKSNKTADRAAMEANRIANYIPITEDLTSYYPMTEDAVDVISGFDGVVNGATLVPDTEYIFDGIDDTIELPEITGFDWTTEDFSFSIWARADGAMSLAGIFSNRSGAVGPGWITLGYNSGTIVLETDGGAAYSSGVGPGVGYKHYGITKTNGVGSYTVKLYINGVLNNTFAVFEAVGGVGNVARMGEWLVPGQNWNGAMRGLRIWQGKAISASEMQAVFNLG